MPLRSPWFLGSHAGLSSLDSSGPHVPNHLPGNLSASLRVANPLVDSELIGTFRVVVPASNCHWGSQVDSAGALTRSSLAVAPLLSCPPSFSSSGGDDCESHMVIPVQTGSCGPGTWGQPGISQASVKLQGCLWYLSIYKSDRVNHRLFPQPRCSDGCSPLCRPTASWV